MSYDSKRTMPVWFLVLSSLSSASVAEVPAPLLDPSTGEIGGRVAVAIYPGLAENGTIVDLPDPEGFVVHLIAADDPDIDLVYECGKWFQPPPRFYRIWIEGEWLMSPYSKGFSYAGGPFNGRGLSTVLPVIEAGRVALPSETKAQPDLSLRLLRATDHTAGHIAMREIARRQRVDRVGAGLLMPVGPVIAALWDERSERYTAISRPFEVRDRETVSAPLERPVLSAHLVAQIRRLSPARTVDEFGMLPVLHLAGRELRPDLKVETLTRVYAVWFDLKPGPAELRIAPADRHPFQLARLELKPGTIERFVGEVAAPDQFPRDSPEQFSLPEN